MSNKHRLRAVALKCLETLADKYDSDFCFLSFKTIAARSGVPQTDVRRTVRFLARKGWAEYGKGLWSDDGLPAGAGYRCTESGFNFMQNLKIKPQQ